MILEAADVSFIRNEREDLRNFQLGSVGIRRDGAKVFTRNSSVRVGDILSGGWSYPSAHAERKLCKMLDYHATVFVARVSKADGSLRMSRPCPSCMVALRSRKVSKCYYSINDFQYGMIDFDNNEYERVFNTHPKKVK